MPFRRREKLHERLAREGGLSQGSEPPPHDARPRWSDAAIHGIHRQREWDAVAAADAPGLELDALEFVVLEDGSFVLDEGLDADAVEPLAAALEGAARPPFRVHAVRRDGATWAAGAKRIRVVELPEAIDGDEIVLSNAHGERSLEVDGARTFGRIPELEALGTHDAFVVRARRLDETLWEVEVSPL